MKKVFLFLYILLISNVLMAQVGINTTNPNTLTELDVKNIINATGDTIPKGIMIPRMTEDQRNSIDVTSDMNLANGLLIYNTDEDCFNYYSKIEETWKSLCGSSKSIFEIPDCSAISVKGKYASGVALDGSNYLTISVQVTKVGSYTISVVTGTNNGYYFYTSGQFLSTGNITVNIPGVGTPTNFTVSGDLGDQLIISINGNEVCDNKYIKVEDSSIKPDYSLKCNTISINGNYIAGTALTESNTITLTLNASATAAGAIYEITTETINGIFFSGSGVLVAGNNNVTLLGSGTPTTNGTNTYQLTTNSTIVGGTTCTVSLHTAARAMKILGISNDDNTYNIGRTGSLLRMALQNPNYFGLNQTSTYPVAGFTFYTATSNPASAITTNNPDIILVQYNYTASSTTDRQALVDFVNNGGVLIYATDGDASSSSRNQDAQALTRLIFNNNTTMTVTGVISGDIQTIENTNSLVTQGPFMNLSGRGMARDAGNNFDFLADGFPYDSGTVISYSSTSNNSIRAFMHKTKGFIFFGDGAPFASSLGNTSAYNYTAKFNQTNSQTYAIPNTYGSAVTYNSHLFLNVMAWAINHAQKNK